MLLKRHPVLAHSVLVILNSSGVQDKRRARTTRHTSKDHHKAIHTLPEIHLTLCAWSNLLIDLHHCLSSNRPHKAARKTRGLYCLTHWNFQPWWINSGLCASKTQNSSHKTSMVYHFFWQYRAWSITIGFNKIYQHPSTYLKQKNTGCTTPPEQKNYINYSIVSKFTELSVSMERRKEHSSMMVFIIFDL